jgi:hypothetical protein
VRRLYIGKSLTTAIGLGEEICSIGMMKIIADHDVLDVILLIKNTIKEYLQ